MGYRTNARKTPAAKTAPNTTKTEPKTTGQTKNNPFADAIDKNGNGRIDVDDLLIGLRDIFQWIFSWRGAMLFFGGFTLLSAGLNIVAWEMALRPIGSAALGTAVLTWGALQALELMPVLDDLNLSASIAALIRLQRKPVEVPVVNQTLQPAAKTQLRKYRNRERSREMVSEFLRYACYGLELSVLVLGGGIFSPIGVNWANILMAIVGIVGVEIGLRKTSECGEKLLNSEEREYLQEIERAVKRSTVTVEPDQKVA